MKILFNTYTGWLSIILIAVFIILSAKKICPRIKTMINLILATYGLICSLMLPSYLLVRLSHNPRVDLEFIQWASKEFINITAVSVVATSVVLAITIWMMIHNKDGVHYIMICAQIFIVMLAFILSLNTINKRFDLASFIFNMGYYNALILLTIPLYHKLTGNRKCDKILNE